MKLLLTIVLIGAAIAVLGPVIATGVGFAFMLGCTLLWFLPFVLILFSDRASGGEKIAWILLMIFFSWFAWIFYFLLAPISRRHGGQRHHYRSAREYRY
jgi:hypothetical protein